VSLLIIQVSAINGVFKLVKLRYIYSAVTAT